VAHRRDKEVQVHENSYSVMATAPTQV
jgi:hypothetical protein